MSSVVELEPQELGFRRPFDHEVSQTLRIYNPQADPIAFKVKTTAPKQYCVRPNSGRIDPKSHVEVQVLLQAMKEDPPLDVRCRDKFLVQSIALDSTKELSTVQSVWQNLEANGKGKVEEKKIRVNFLPADGSDNVSSHAADESFARDSPTPAPRTPQRVSDAAPVGAVSRPESKPENSKHLGDALDSTRSPATEQYTIGAAASNVAGAVANAVPTSSDDLKSQLAEAKATIAKLQSQAQDSVLRQRKTEATSRDAKEQISSGLGVQHATASGVPVQIVAGLCLLCFLVAYFFF